ncbi:hypothetical protein C2845_PM05G12270 [Panicum miliaceum]|uniref:Uncharacterized protein n=1 Tax=Panicum miliaceum TaxID=4540 RepID=A0A3L6T5B3_PANMI|nr:hypothetical protein C2845_PM05G12270 [Panicum miliaceum]
MDCAHHQPRPTPDPEPSPAPAPPTAAPQETTGDSESDTTVSALLAGDHPSVPGRYDDEDDAESCSGGDSGRGLCSGATSAAAAGDGSDGDDDDVGAERGEAEVDSRMAVPWWRRMAVEGAAAAHDDGGCCAPAAEGGAVAGAGGHAAESNVLFWEACIAHGY